MSGMTVETRGKKSLEPVLADSVRVELRQIISERYGTQLAASKAFGMSQSHLSEILGGTRGPGLNFMIRLRELTGRSIDDLLGLAPVATSVEARLAKLERAMGRR